MARRFSRPVPRWALVASGIAAGLVVVATVAAATTTMKDSSGETKTVTKVASPPPPPAVVTVANLKGTTVPWDKPLIVTITGGKLLEVGATQDDGGTVSGSLSADASKWQSAGTFVPLTRLMLFVSYLDEKHERVMKDFALSVGDSVKHLRATLSPGDGDVVGVGEPVVVYFSRWVPEKMRAEVQQRLSVSTTPAVDGAWHWFNGQEVHWRPPSYWAPGTKVTVHSDLSKLDVGDGIWGTGAHTSTFTVGAAHVSKVDVAGHVMRVYSGGQLLKTMPISAGRDKYPTMGGVHIALDKAQLVVMDSATVGIPKGDPDYYYEKVYWNVRVTNGGAFVHAAPWSVGEQGRANVSHGCINLSPANATWFYNFSRRGDIVDIYNTNRGPSPSDAGTMDWNMSWSSWLAGSALPDTSTAPAPATTSTQPATTQTTRRTTAQATTTTSPAPSPSTSPSATATATPSTRPKPTATPSATAH